MFPKKYIFILIFIAAVLLCGKEAKAAAEFVSTIRAAGGDYSMLSTWEAAVQSNLTASTTVVYSGTGTGGISAGATLELFRAGVYQNITALKIATTSDQLLVQTFTGSYKVLQDGDQWRVASSTANMWTVSSAGLGDSAIAVAECYNDWPTGLNDNVTVDGWTTNATNYVKIYAPEGERHNGKAKDGAGNYTGFALKMNTTWTGAIVISALYCQIEGIIFDGNSKVGSSGVKVNILNSYVKVEKCIFMGGFAQGLYNYADGGSKTYVSNCIAYDCNYGFYMGSWRYAYLYNCVAIDNNSYGFYKTDTGGNSPICKNCLAKNNGTDFYMEWDNTNSASSDATADDWGGTGNRINQTFTFLDEANDDFHLSPSDSGAKNQGTDLSADASYPITDDIDYQTRPYGGIWDIGADQIFKATQINSPQTNVLNDDSLVGYWSFNGADMGTTSATDLSGNSNTGWLMNGVKKVPGISGQGMSFDGTDDYVEVPYNAVLDNPSAFTLSVWAKSNIPGIDYTAAGFIIDMGVAASEGYGILIDHNTNDIQGYYNAHYYNCLANLDTSWHHYVFSFNGTYINLYQDGIAQISPQAETVDGITNYPLRIGGESKALERYFSGLIDEVRVYNRALSADEIGELYRAGARKMKIDPTKGYKTNIGN